MHGKVAFRNGKIADVVNAIRETKPDVSKKIYVDLPTTNVDEKTFTDISNSIDTDVERNETKSDELRNRTGKTTETCESTTDNKEELSALILTPFIEQGRIGEARNVSKVNSELFLGVESYSGYFTVNKMYNSNIFFWYFPVENKPVETTPWIVWLQGGPGASSMTGIFEEIGPFKIQSSFVLKSMYMLNILKLKIPKIRCLVCDFGNITLFIIMA